MKVIRLFVLLSIGYCLLPTAVFSQRSKDGAKVVATLNNIVNEYTTLSADAATGTTTITVANSMLNANLRFPGALAAGDLILIIQMQGATILGQPDQWTPTVGSPNDSTWGEITNYNNCGNWEFAEVYSVPNSTSITLDCPLSYNYTAAGRAQIVRIPRYASLTINNGGEITCDAWTGSVGGICAIEVENNTIISAGGEIDGTGKGFRGAQLNENLTAFGFDNTAATNADAGAEKGESIAGYQNDYTPYGGMYGRGAAANSGGGGCAHNGGGGGGANGGNPLAWSGHGVPNTSIPGWINAWNLQYAGFAAQTSSGGGQGGYTCSDNNQDATITGPNNASWSCDQRRSDGGIGGRPLDYSTGKLFLGGGGGSGDQNDNNGGSGGNGGAMIYLMNYGTVSGAGQFISNGNNGVNATGTPPLAGTAGRDAAGGAGAGGTIIVNSVGTVFGISITASGGKGGDQVITKDPFYFGAENEAEGTGGGGGGGYIGISNGTPVRTTSGGANGTTNSDGLTEFLPNGATQGGAGTNNASVTNFIINAPNVTICSGQSATLTATLNGTVPGGTTIIWYDNLVAGNVLGNGNTYTTTVLAVGTYTYYVGTCPGTYHQPVVVTVISSPIVSAGNDVTICNGGNTSLIASGGTGYAWSPTTGLSNPNISNPVATPVSTTTYVVTVTSSCGNANDTVVITVNSSITASISGNTTICTGGSTTLTASGGGNYSWTTGATTAAINVSPTSTITYSVIVGSGSCADTASVTVNVSNGITASITGPSAVCTGNSATLTASGGNNYSWTTGATTSSITVTPTSSTTYSVIVSSGICSDTASITVTVSSSITATISGNTTICSGGSTTLTASGGTNFSWTTGATTATIIDSPTSTTTYSVIVSSGSCADTTSVTITVSTVPSTSIFGNTLLCTGDATTLSASGGNTYSWSNGATTSSIIISPTASSTYSVIATAGLCSDTDSISVNVSLPPVAGITCIDSICSGWPPSVLTAIGGSNYSWNTGATTSSILVSPQTNTSYSVIVSTGVCSDTANCSIVVNPSPVVNAGGDVTINSGSSITLIATGSGGTYVWYDGLQTTTSIVVSPNSTTSYAVFVTSLNGCNDADTVIVFVNQEIIDCPDQLFLPNAFSPNDDGENDSLQIYYGIPECIKTLHLVIYNRWGQKVYETSDPAFKWGGVYNQGEPKETQKGNTEVLPYYMDVEIADGTFISKKGNISLVR